MSLSHRSAVLINQSSDREHEDKLKTMSTPISMQTCWAAIGTPSCLVSSAALAASVIPPPACEKQPFCKSTHIKTYTFGIEHPKQYNE